LVSEDHPCRTKVAPRPSSLALVETFRDLSPAQLAELEQRLLTVPNSHGQVLTRLGNAADALYIVASGRLAVDVDGRRVAEVLGSRLGEIGFFADGIRSATVTALRDSSVLKLPQADFVVLTDRHPRVVERQRSSTSHFRLLS
jgi:NTE family protein